MLTTLLNAYARFFQRWMPSPLSIAVLLSVLAGGMAVRAVGWEQSATSWVNGLWNPGLLRFGFQAMFMLVLGHVLALAPPMLNALNRAVIWVMNRPRLAPAKIALVAMSLGWLNWGLGLVGGAILVRGALDWMRRNPEGRTAHPGVLGAAGYTGLLVWHGGLSGSAPLKVAEPGHLAELAPHLSGLPDSIGLRDTLFAGWSWPITFAVAVATALVFVWLGRQSNLEVVLVPEVDGNAKSEVPVSRALGLGERLDRSRMLAGLLGVACWGGAIWGVVEGGWSAELRFITPDWINTVLLGTALVAHGSMAGVLRALDAAIGGASGILIQFPLYFGIIGLVTGTGLGAALANALVGATSSEALPFALFLSSGVLNVFVPSGGGQWAVQGPLVLETCQTLHVPFEQGIMAMAFGDELTNMLQPFWALPLLGITGLRARDILPYTLLVMLVAGSAMLVGLACWG